jgi:hypothetical protein
MAGHDDNDGRYYVDLDDVHIHDDGTVHLNNDKHYGRPDLNFLNNDIYDNIRPREQHNPAAHYDVANDYVHPPADDYYDDNVAAFFRNYRARHTSRTETGDG